MNMLLTLSVQASVYIAKTETHHKKYYLHIFWMLEFINNLCAAQTIFIPHEISEKINCDFDINLL